MVLRSTGFPVADLLGLTDSGLTSAADDPGTGDTREAWDNGMRLITTRMLSITGTDRFLEALMWQNPPLIDRLHGWFLRHTEPDGTHVRNSVRRSQETGLARYIQRYHTRNETIGFFGPSAWAAFSDDVSRLTVTPGPELVSGRQVYFEDWLIDAVGGAFAEVARLRHELPPGLPNGVVVHGNFISQPGKPPIRLGPDEAAVIRAVDGRRVPAQLEQLVPEVGGLPRVLETLERLREQGLIVWRPNVPIDRWPERGLRDELTRLTQSPERTAALAALDRLEAAKDEVAAAGGRPDLLPGALARLGEEFQSITGNAAQRTSDISRVGRCAVFEECGRDVSVRLGTELREALAPPLALLLDSARWLVWRFGVQVEQLIDEVYDEFNGLTEVDGVHLVLFLRRFLQKVDDPAWIAPLLSEFQRIWGEILEIDPSAARVRRSVADLADAVATRFAAPAPTWYAGAHHSPDIMIAARGPEAIAAGDYEFVLGELHLTTITLDASTFLTRHEAPERIAGALESRLELRPRVVPAYSRSEELTGRDYPSPETYSDKYWYLTFSPGNGERPTPEKRRLPLADLVAARDGATGVVGVRTPSGETLAVRDFLGEFCVAGLANLFSPITPLAHTPRVTIDRLVMARETWRVPVAEIPTGKNEDEFTRFAAVRRWARDRGMPRFVFWRAAAGAKPIYLDFESPLFVTDFIASVRKAARKDGTIITISEMCPDPHHVWLTDAEGRRYTSELRIAVLDESR
ncbi:lantibiotic dehydratase [Rhizohabitans arisaemae]|uniref:lantibiotic dehydratase n=1 Tax=Rhizohabitans arisaemae TaxID=2720610 RepID=UPI0024B18212|nr:lantibiotic dehydratase [Rhizohabitans arisaemae]